jgi:hypothetical protein
MGGYTMGLESRAGYVEGLGYDDMGWRSSRV